MTRNFVRALLATAVLLHGCAKDARDANGQAAGLPAVPPSWVEPQGAASDEASLAPASNDLTQSVQAAFHAHTTALEEISGHDQSAVPPGLVSLTDRPADWAPWHLDGLIAGFAIDVGGIFGTLVADGAPSVKVTWQKQAASLVPTARAKSPGATSVRIHAGMSAQDLSRVLEPTVQMASASRSVRDPGALRRNLNAEGQKFLSLVRVLSAVSPGPAWHIDGYQLSLSVTAAGDVTPAISVGGTFLVIFDWQASPAQAVTALPALDAREADLRGRAESFARTIAALLPQARADAAEIRRTGFELQVFQVGVGLTVGGDIGIATAQAFGGGRIIFKKNDTANFVSAMEPLTGLDTVPMIGGGDLTSTANGGAASSVALPFAAYQVSANRIRNGLGRAIRMGAFFARQARAVETPNWKTTEIELGLDASIGGNIGLVTVAGSGLIRLGFERVEK